MSEIEALLNADTANVPVAQEWLRAFHADLPDAMDEAASLFKTFLRAFGQGAGAGDTEDYTVVDECLTSLGLTTDEAWDAAGVPIVLSGDPARDECIKRCRAAIHCLHSRAARPHLLLIASRSYMFAATDLLRMRVTPMYGHLRIEVEAAACACLMRQEPSVAVEWLRVGLMDGWRFHNKHSGALRETLARLKLAHASNLGSAVALHPRFASTVGGRSYREREERGRRIQETSLSFQEGVGGESHEFVLPALHLVDTQAASLGAFVEALPEAYDPVLMQNRLPHFELRVRRLWQHFNQLFPAVAERAAARRAELESET